MKNQQLNDFFGKVQEAATSIQFASKLVEQVRDNDELYNKYSPELNKMIIEYNQQVVLLRKTLEKFFETENKNGYPINLDLRKAYQSLNTL